MHAREPARASFTEYEPANDLTVSKNSRKSYCCFRGRGGKGLGEDREENASLFRATAKGAHARIPRPAIINGIESVFEFHANHPPSTPTEQRLRNLNRQ